MPTEVGNEMNPPLHLRSRGYPSVLGLLRENERQFNVLSSVKVQMAASPVPYQLSWTAQFSKAIR